MTRDQLLKGEGADQTAELRKFWRQCVVSAMRVSGGMHPVYASTWADAAVTAYRAGIGLPVPYKPEEDRRS
jgi:hypothetical protein